MDREQPTVSPFQGLLVGLGQSFIPIKTVTALPLSETLELLFQ
jgi:hypothetical protein